MDKEDARYQKLEQLHERRKQVARLHRKGHGVMQIVELTGLSYPAVRLAIDLYESGGAAALKPAPRGRVQGQGRSLEAEQEEAIRRTICDKRPEQLKMDFALWTRAAVMQLIERQCGIRLSVRAVGNYLKRWGFTPQKPIRRAYEQRPEAVQRWLEQEYPAIERQCGIRLSVRAVGNYLKRWGVTPQKPIRRAYEQRPEAVKRWLEQEYPAIERRAKVEGGEIHWGDETALVNTDVRGRGYSPKGKTPVAMAVGGTREKLSMISTVTNQGKASWMIVEGTFNHERLIEFFEALVAEGRRAHKKVFLILDNLGVHHCKPVKGWLAERLPWIEVFYLPSYSPELNPDERLNADLKHAIGSKVPVRTKAKLKAAANEHMTFIEANPERVKSYFQDPRVKYAA